jgi:predicted lipoprotein with Yx(FWY)xxD motif
VSITVRPFARRSTRRLLGGSLILGAALTVAACGGSSGTAQGSGSGSSSGTASTGTSSSSAVTISLKSVPGVGTVLVNGEGRTLYMLTSEKGDKITCTDSNGCTKVWPEISLPSGTSAAKAGSGVHSSLLGTVKDASGNMEVTYNGWPLYTYVGDSGPGAAHGQGLTSFGGTWYVLNAAGSPVTGQGQPASSPSSSSAGGSGYGY